MVSARTSTPTRRPAVRRKAPAPIRAAEKVSRPALAVGHSIHRSSRPPRKSVRRCGASRNDRALRVGGVSTTMRPWSSSIASSYSFSMAMYSWVPDSVSAIRR